MKMRYKGVLILLGIILCLNIVSADFELGNESYELQESYALGSDIQGWVNLSLDEEESESVFEGFDNEISVYDMLEANDLDYTCFPSDCEERYTVSNPSESKTIDLWNADEEIIGLRLEEDVKGFNGPALEFNFSSNIGEYCLTPLKIDVLDDGSYEWLPSDVSEDICVIDNPYGCFEGSSEMTDIDYDYKFCQKINVSYGKGFEIGAVVNGTGYAEFEFTLGDEDCDANASESGEISCLVELEQEIEQAEVCIEKLSGDNFKIKYEDNNPCGSSESESGSEEFDFEIFAYPRKYSPIGEKRFDEYSVLSTVELKDYLWNYVYSRYGGNCSNGCVIPISFKSTKKQDIQLSDLNVNYDIGLGAESHEFYDIEKEDFLISSDFQKIDLGRGNFTVPDEIDEYDFELELGGSEIFSQEISVLPIPQIIEVKPTQIPVLVEYPLKVILDGFGNLSYHWDFGDGSSKTSNEKIVEHKYSSMGSYDVTVEAGNEFGNTSKTVSINVISPEEHINTTLNKYNKRLDKIEDKINELSPWVREEVKDKMGFDDLKSDVNYQEKKYDNAMTDEQYVDVMKGLLNISVPDNFRVGQGIESSKLVLNSEQFNIDSLVELGAGDKKQYQHGSVIEWLNENVDLRIESKTYSIYFGQEKEVVYSYMKINLKPNKEIRELYFLVNGEPNEIILNNENDKKIESGRGLYLSDVEDKTIEILYPERISLVNFPVYVSPRFKELGEKITLEICDNDGECEEGENSENCPNDCKPIGLSIFWLIVLLIAAVLVYIFLQEWYKRYYEDHLFHNKNELFNLINFMNNSMNQGLRKHDIFSKLKDMGWKGEQLSYAWKKLHGKRTGMWEIPVFKWFENMQVKKEVEKRGGKINKLNFRKY